MKFARGSARWIEGGQAIFTDSHSSYRLSRPVRCRCSASRGGRDNVTTRQRRRVDKLASCHSSPDQRLQIQVFMFSVAALGCVMATFVAHANSVITANQPTLQRWGTSLGGATCAEIHEDADSVTCVKFPVEPGDSLVIASADQRSLDHALSLIWAPGTPHTVAASSIWSTAATPLQVRTMMQLEESSLGLELLSRGSSNGSDSQSPPPRQQFVTNLPTVRVFRVPCLPPQSRLRPPPSDRMSERVCRTTLITQVDRVSVYATDATFSASTAKTVATAISRTIRPGVERRIGPIADIDENGSLSVVLSPLAFSASTDGQPLLGCVRPADFLNDNSVSGDIIYLDPQIVESPAQAAVLAHELAHAAVFSRLRHWRNRGQKTRMLPPWLNEGIAHACERNMFPDSPNLTGRIESWLDDTGRWPLVPSVAGRRGLSARGPGRTAGLFFVEFLQDQQSLIELVDSAILQTDDRINVPHKSFATTFAEWTIWMARHHGSSICRTPISGEQTVRICGTAARWYRMNEPGTVTIRSDRASKLMVTLLKAAGQKSDHESAQSMLSIASKRSE